MKKFIIPLLLLSALSSCIVEVDLTPSYIEIGNIEEYESKEVINEIWAGDILVYEEFLYHTNLEIEFINTGGRSARNIWADITFFDGSYIIKTTRIHLPTIYAGDTYIYEFDSGFESINQYSDYEVSVSWD